MKKISVILPTYNRAHYLDQAIQSVLEQTSIDFELIISDNASTDDTNQIVKKYISDKRVRYYCNKKNIGMVANWNKAIYELSKYDYFIILSDDDYFIDKNYITDAIKILENDSIKLLYSGGYILNTKNGKKIKLNLPFQGITEGATVFLSRNTVTPQDFTLCNVIFKKTVAQKYNSFNNYSNYSCDTELFLNSCLEGNVYVHNKEVSVYRIHGGNLINDVATDPRLLSSNLNAFLNPYKNALNKIDPAKLEVYLKNCHINKMIRKSVVLSELSKNQESLRELNRIKTEFIQIYSSATKSHLFKVSFFTAKNLSTLYKEYLKLISTLRKFKNRIRGLP